MKPSTYSGEYSAGSADRHRGSSLSRITAAFMEILERRRRAGSAKLRGAAEASAPARLHRAGRRLRGSSGAAPGCSETRARLAASCSCGAPLVLVVLVLLAAR